jgi:DMSO/TMAO reductase YedYZ molybdopterin-dependent catalytic subunit
MTTSTLNDNSRQSLNPWLGRLAGAIAMLGMLGVFVLGRRGAGAISLLDALADALLLAMPISVFSWLLEMLGPQAKTLLLVGLVLVLVLIGAWLGGRFMRQAVSKPALVWREASLYALVLFLCSVGFVLLFVNSQSPAVFANGGFMKTALVLGVGAIVFALVLAGLVVLFLDARSDTESEGRRRLIAWGGVAIAAMAGLVAVGQEVGRVAGRKTNIGGSKGELSSAITPVDDFYVISKNFVDPTNDRGPDWSVAVGGLVDNELTLKQADLEALGREEFISTQLCISNPVGGDLVGTAEWTGVPLKAVLERAGVREGAFKVVFEGTDGYKTGVPIERVMRPESHLVWGMNGEPLPQEHGVPVRAVIPGLYGMKSVKWLTRMTVTEDDFKGYWEQRSWTDDAIVKTMSRIDTPVDHEVLPVGTVEIGGVAFGGDRGVKAVEVSTDDGKTWETAEIREDPNPDGIAWVVWTYSWKAATGAHVLVVRAINDNGDVQTSERASELPDGASGWHRVTVGVT